jgi:hypothetical protein
MRQYAGMPVHQDSKDKLLPACRLTGALLKKSGNQRAPFDTAAEEMRPTQDERQNTLTFHTQPLVLSSRPLLAAYRRAPAGSSCAKPLTGATVRARP